MPINFQNLIRGNNRNRSTFIESDTRNNRDISSAINLDVSDISSIFQLMGMMPRQQSSSDQSSDNTNNVSLFNTQINPQDINGAHGVVQLEISGITTTFFNSDSPTNSTPPNSGVSIHQLLNDTSLIIASDSRNASSESDISDESAVCSICNENIENGFIIRKINRCGHYFHDRCINRWFVSHSTCPMCRAEIST